MSNQSYEMGLEQEMPKCSHEFERIDSKSGIKMVCELCGAECEHNDIGYDDANLAYCCECGLVLGEGDDCDSAYDNWKERDL